MKRIASLLAASIATASPGLALAQTQPPAAGQTVPCLERSAAIAHLGKKYSEAPVAMGLTHNGAVLEVLSSDTGDNWTIIVTMPNGTTCMIAAGQSWEKVPRTALLGPGA